LLLLLKDMGYEVIGFDIAQSFAERAKNYLVVSHFRGEPI